MPRVSRKARQRAYKENERVLKLFGNVFVMPVFRISRSLIHARPIKEYQYPQNIVFDVIALLMFFAVLIMLGGMSIWGYRAYIFWQIAGVFAGIILLSFIVFLFRKRIITLPYFSGSSKSVDYISLDIGNHIEKALGIMDTTAKYYNDENEANRELVSTLKAMNVNATYQYPLPNGRIADAKVSDLLVEGKLSPNITDVDGLLGQIIDYTQYGDKLYIVIYGKLDNNSKRRIENEIHLRYPQRVFLATLPNPRRLRVDNLQS